MLSQADYQKRCELATRAALRELGAEARERRSDTGSLTPVIAVSVSGALVGLLLASVAWHQRSPVGNNRPACAGSAGGGSSPGWHRLLAESSNTVGPWDELLAYQMQTWPLERCPAPDPIAAATALVHVSPSSVRKLGWRSHVLRRITQLRTENTVWATLSASTRCSRAAISQANRALQHAWSSLQPALQACAERAAGLHQQASLASSLIFAAALLWAASMYAAGTRYTVIAAAKRIYGARHTGSSIAGSRRRSGNGSTDKVLLSHVGDNAIDMVIICVKR